MKHNICLSVLALALAASGAAAQDFAYSSADFAKNAVSYNETTYYGTARTLAMGNAFTAIGGDLGSIEINPAGSAVAGYSQAAYSGALSIAGASTTYSPVWGSPSTASAKSSVSGFSSPCYGATLRFGNEGSIQNITCGILASVSNNFLGNVQSGGFQSGSGMTSMCGAFAAAANASGLPSNLFYDVSLYNRRYSGDYDWSEVAAFGGNLIAYSDALRKYIPSTSDDNGETVSGTELYQYYSRATSGSNKNFILNFAANWEDKLYLGLNIGFTTKTYAQTLYISERSTGSEIPVKFEDEAQTAFSSAYFRSSFSTKATGLQFKVGALYVPTPYFRVGLAFTAPSKLYYTENYTLTAGTTYLNGRSFYDSPDSEDSFSYNLTSPYEVNVGVAAVIGQFGLVSLDYELKNYASMNYTRYGSNLPSEYFLTTNELISKFCGVQHSLRLGAEFRLNSFFSLRAGYNFTTSPEKYYTDGVDDVYIENYIDGPRLRGLRPNI